MPRTRRVRRSDAFEPNIPQHPIVDGADHCPPFTPQCVGATRLARYPQQVLRAAAIALPRALLAGGCYGGSLLCRSCCARSVTRRLKFCHFSRVSCRAVRLGKSCSSIRHIVVSIKSVVGTSGCLCTNNRSHPFLRPSHRLVPLVPAH
jgi:hypothetical protein